MPQPDVFDLRPMEERDLRTVWTWRNSERLRAVSFTDHEIPWEEHLAWYARSKASDSTQPMLFEVRGKRAGFVNFARIDRSARSGVWGFYIGDERAPKGSGLILGFLALDHAFGELGLQSVVGETFVSNEVSVRYHQTLGFREVNEERVRVQKNGQPEEVMRLRITAKSWKDVRSALARRLFPEVSS